LLRLTLARWEERAGLRAVGPTSPPQPIRRILGQRRERVTDRLLTGRRKKLLLAFRRRGDQGAGAAEVVIAVALLMLIILAIVQFAVWANAVSVAQATAEEARRCRHGHRDGTGRALRPGNSRELTSCESCSAAA
jgi:hypothetical protein